MIDMETYWKVIRYIIYLILNKIFQFIKFGIVGLSNTVICYITYVVLIFLNIHYLLASCIGFLVSIINAFYWNNKVVFTVQRKEEGLWWKVFLKMFITYAITGLFLNNILLILWVNIWENGEISGPIINLFFTIPINFLLNKYWVFR